MDGGVGGPMVSLVSPEVKHGISRVVNYIEDMYGLTVKPVRLVIKHCVSISSISEMSIYFIII